MNWTNQFIEKLEHTAKKKNISLHEAFQYLTPLREKNIGPTTIPCRASLMPSTILKMKCTSLITRPIPAMEVKDAIKLQLAIYSLLYFEKHGKMPTKAGIFFLRHKLKLVPVDEELLELAKREIELVHAHTSKTEKKEDYHKTINPLCKWNGSKCDFPRSM